MCSKRGYGSGGFISRSRSADSDVPSSDRGADYQNIRFFFMISGGFRGKNRKNDFLFDFALKNMYNYSSRRPQCVGINGRTDDNSPAEMTVG